MIATTGIIGDVHGEAELLGAAIEFLRRQGPDIVLCTGDLPTRPGDAVYAGALDDCCRLLIDAGVQCVRGNHDRWFLERLAAGNALGDPEESAGDEALAFLSALPATRVYETPAGRLLLCHGLGEDDMAGVYPGDHGYAIENNHRLHALVIQADYRIIVNGHTHQRMLRTIDGLAILNAGTLRRRERPGFAMADFAAGRVQFYEIDAAGEIIPEPAASLSATL